MKSDLPELFQKICRCEILQDYFTAPNNNPCKKIIESQRKLLKEDFNLNNIYPPEPWMEDFMTAEVLFVGINPTINEKEFKFPKYSSENEKIYDYLKNRWKRSICVNSGKLGYQISKERWKFPKYWSEIRTALQFLYQIDDISPLIKNGRVSLIDVVHCKSRKRIGVNKSLGICSYLYLEQLLNISPAKIILVSGKEANLVFQIKYGCTSFLSKQNIGKRERYIICRSAPGSKKKRKLSKLFNEDSDELNEIRQLLKKE